MRGTNWLSSWVKVNNRNVAFYSDESADGAGKRKQQQRYQSHNNNNNKRGIESCDDAATTRTGTTSNDRSPPDNDSLASSGRSSIKTYPQSGKQRQHASSYGTKSLPGDNVKQFTFRGIRHTKSVSCPQSSHASGELSYRNTGRYLNEAAFMQQLEQRQRASDLKLELGVIGGGGETKRSEHASSSPSSPPPPPPPVPAPLQTLKTANLACSTSSVATQQTTTSSTSDSCRGSDNNKLKFFPPFFAKSDSPGSSDQQQQLQCSSNNECASCKALEEKLFSAFEDIEYLRTAALQQEYTCAAYQQGGRNGIRNHHNRPSSLGDCTKQVTEATNRHRKQVEQLTKERVRWQQDIHFKLHKFANLCKDLNEDSVVRSERAVTLEQEMREIKAERDATAEEANRLRSRVQELERQEAEWKESTRRLLEYEERGMHHAEAAIQSRDGTIDDLSTKLEAALDELEIERAQRQRRQIIFPVSVPSNEYPKS